MCALLLFIPLPHSIYYHRQKSCKSNSEVRPGGVERGGGERREGSESDKATLGDAAVLQKGLEAQVKTIFREVCGRMFSTGDEVQWEDGARPFSYFVKGMIHSHLLS